MSGTAPEQEVLYELMEKIFKSKTGQRLYDLLNTKNKIKLCFYHKVRRGEEEKPEGFCSLPLNQISVNIHKVRSQEARINTLTHELFHALQYKTRTIHKGFNLDEAKQVFILNEVEARFKSMEILNELYPNANFALADLPYAVKIECLVYKALQEQAQKSLMVAGQKSPEIAKKISKRLARAEMIKSQLFSMTPYVAQVLGNNWSNEFEAMNQAWQKSYDAKDTRDLTSIKRCLPCLTKPKFSEIQTMIANRLELPVDVLQKTPQPKQGKSFVSHKRIILASRASRSSKT